MKTPTKQELYNQIEALQNEMIKQREEIEKERRIMWEKRLPEAKLAFHRITGKIFPGAVKNVIFEHVDASGYWFTFELVNDSRRQTYAVRHEEVERS